MADELLRRRVFWAWYHRLRELPEAPPRFVRVEDEEIPVPGGTADFIFGPEEDVVAFERRFLPERFELALPFRGGFIWRIRFQNLGHSHWLEHPRWAAPVRLGHADPHPALPILRVAEVEALARGIDPSASPTTPTEAAMLLLAVADHHEEGAEALLASATRRIWSESGLLTAEKIELLVQALQPRREPPLAEDPEALYWEPPAVHHWEHDASRGWLTDARNSHRNPKGRWTSEDFERMRRFLETHERD